MRQIATLKTQIEMRNGTVEHFPGELDPLVHLQHVVLQGVATHKLLVALVAVAVQVGPTVFNTGNQSIMRVV